VEGIGYDIAVIGAGAFGSWIAWHLRRAGKSVVLMDAWGPANSRASSGGESRIIRMGYGADAVYTRLAMRSLELWQELFLSAGEGLFHRSGVLWMARENDLYSAATCRTLQEAGVPFEILSAAALRRCYPQMQTPVSYYGIFEPRSGALMARRAVAAVVADAVRQGVVYETRAVAAHANPLADVTIYACGAWLGKLFPELLGDRIHPTRQEVFFFAPPSGDARFSPERLPVWIDFSDPRGPYGFPDLESRGFKLAFDRHGPPFDPDSGDRCLTEEGLAEARRFLAERFPDLRDAPLSEARVCQYENTSSGDFLIDRHPERSDIWLVGGGSGHGFKHGPAVGEYVADLILRGGTPDPRFLLASKRADPRRTVY
jgi:glycine/D-amino acid oxidase-like deaminating enzyme